MKLQEAYKLDTADDFFEAVKSNKIGVKIPQELRQDIISMSDEDKANYTESINYLKDNFNDHNIKVVTGFQALLKMVSSMSDISTLVDKLENGNYSNCYADEEYAKKAFYFLIKYANEKWAQPFIEKAISKSELYEYCMYNSEEIIDEVYSHGSLSKGTGDLKDVIMLYPRLIRGWEDKINPYECDSDGWQLFIPTSFDGERAIAWYGTNPQDMQPTHWCTRANIYRYRQYTGQTEDDNDETNLYVVRNLHTGKAWQIAIQRDCLNFLNEQDAPDNVTKGDFVKLFPDEILKQIKDDFIHEYFSVNARTFYDYKVYSTPSGEQIDEYYEYSDKHFDKPFVLSNYRQDNRIENTYEPVLRKVKELTNSDVYIVENGCTTDNYIAPESLSLSDYFEHDYEYGYKDKADHEDNDYEPSKTKAYGIKSRRPIYKVVLKTNPNDYEYVYFNDGVYTLYDGKEMPNHSEELLQDVRSFVGYDKQAARLAIADSNYIRPFQLISDIVEEYLNNSLTEANVKLSAIDSKLSLPNNPRLYAQNIRYKSLPNYPNRYSFKFMPECPLSINRNGIQMTEELIFYSEEGNDLDKIPNGTEEYFEGLVTSGRRILPTCEKVSFEACKVIVQFLNGMLSELKRKLFKYTLPSNKWQEMLQRVFNKVLNG